MRKIRAFTLIEVLVVVSIITLLLGIRMPSLKEVRRLSKRTVCQKNLDQIGVGVHAYLMSNKDTFFSACRFPSAEKDAAAAGHYSPLPSLPEVLRKELGQGGEVFECPADQNTMMLGAPPDGIPTRKYFPHEGTSYEWESKLNGVALGFKLVRIYGQYADKRIELGKLDRKNMWMVYDFEPFHGGEVMVGSHNILYTDLHVEADRWTMEKQVGQALMP